MLKVLGKGGQGAVLLVQDYVPDKAIPGNLGPVPSFQALKIASVKHPQQRALLSEEERVAWDKSNRSLVKEAGFLKCIPPHPNVASILHVEAHRELGFVVSMEVAKHGDLRNWLRICRPSWGERVRALAEVARGLNWLHVLGFVHQDLKPGNVLMYEDRDTEVPSQLHGGQLRGGFRPVARVSDFGLLGGKFGNRSDGPPVLLVPRVDLLEEPP